MDPRTTYERRAEVQILDVREPDEWMAAHIDGAVHIPMRQVPERLDELDLDGPVVAVCRSGHRSGQVAKYLQKQGFDVHNMPGGLQAWVDAGLPVQRGRG